eukprot:TRINITY_DN11625_c0_g1_i7.p1 TRINITY_DN11625_c0_g1~~TRINITY_DN11625_c0_g1_i7.p1  ORF type:complete len:610 (+),score=107.51 TRINITY_DN11625_c0_g1_i7:2063-3892(+)
MEPADAPRSALMIRLQELAVEPRSTLCRGFKLKGRHFFNSTLWDTLRDHDNAQEGMISHREHLLDEFYAQAASFMMPHLERAVRDCAGGVATAFVIGLPYISRLMGDEAAFRYFVVARILLYPLLQHRDRLNSGWSLLNGRSHRDGMLFAPNWPALPDLFGTRSRNCGSGHLRIKVLHDQSRTEYSLRCSGGLRSTEVWLHRQLVHSNCAVIPGHEDDDSADYIFFPLYSVCRHTVRQHFRPLHAQLPLVRPYYELAEDTERTLDDLRQKLGADMVDGGKLVLFMPEEKWPLLNGVRQAAPTGASDGLPPPRPRLLVVEARPLHCTHYDRVRIEAIDKADSRMRCFHCHDCFRPGYDVVVPSFVDYYVRSKLMSVNQPYNARELLLVHHGAGGAGSGDGIYTEVVNWRWEMEKMAKLPAVSIGGHLEEYHIRLGQARFCLIPKGVGYWTHRLYEALLAGCVPVIASDFAVLPFEGILGIRWSEFSVRWPEDRLGSRELFEWLRSLDNSGHGASLKAGVDRFSCWFDYHSSEDCNALAAIVQALSAASPRRPAVEVNPGPRYWNSPPFPERSAQELFLDWLRRQGEYNMTLEEVVSEAYEAGQIFGGTMA